MRELTDGEFVTVVLEGVHAGRGAGDPALSGAVRSAGRLRLRVGADNKAEQRRIQLGQSTPTIAAVISGLAVGDNVIVEGLQRARPGQAVSPGPASPQILSSMKAAASDTAPQTDHGASGKTRPADNKP